MIIFGGAFIVFIDKIVVKRKALRVKFDANFSLPSLESIAAVHERHSCEHVRVDESARLGLKGNLREENFTSPFNT